MDMEWYLIIWYLLFRLFCFMHNPRPLSLRYKSYNVANIQNSLYRSMSSHTQNAIACCLLGNHAPIQLLVRGYSTTTELAAHVNTIPHHCSAGGDPASPAGELGSEPVLSTSVSWPDTSPTSTLLLRFGKSSAGGGPSSS